MAIQTPFHPQRLRLPHQWHSIDPTVTGFATDAFVHVNAVIEVNEIWNVVHPRPFNWAIVAEARPNRLQRWTVGPHLLVTVHAHLRRRNSGKGGGLNRCVTVAAVDAKPRHMMFVAKRHGLITNHPLCRNVRRADDAAPRQRHGDYDRKASEDREARDGICRSVKDLRHCLTTGWQLFTSGNSGKFGV